MPLSLEAMQEKGRTKLIRKGPSISAAYNAAKERMKRGYALCPFGETRKRNYVAGIDAAVHRVDPEKWARNWVEKMRE
jgi:hypothetical protein